MNNYNEPQYGPPENKPFIIMIPISAIIRWFKKRKKHKEKRK